MKRNKLGKWIALTAVLLMVFACTVAASAEENGYWTETVDSEGRQIRIFTYTEPVEITYTTDGDGCALEDNADPADPEQAVFADGEAKEPVAVAENAALRLADNGVKTAQAIPAGSSPLGGVAALGAVLLLVLGVALYKAV